MMLYTKLIVFVVLLVVGHVQSRVTSDISVLSPTGHDVEPRCPHDTTTNSTSVLPLLLTKQSSCIHPYSTFNRLMFIAVFKGTYFADECANLPTVRACLDEVGIDAAACLENMEAKMFKMSRENADIAVSFTCVDSSDMTARELAREAHELRTSPQTQSLIEVLNCFIRSERDTQRSADIPAYTMQMYRDTEEAHRCMMNVTQEHQLKTSSFEKFYHKYIGSMKCISPVTKEIVLCASLE